MLDAHAMPHFRRPIPEQLLVLWYILLAPLGGAVTAVIAFNLLVRSWVPPGSAGWLAVACAAAGLLAGGAVGSRVPPSVPESWFAAHPLRAAFNAAAVAIAVIAIGLPAAGLSVTAAALALLGAAFVLRRGRRQER